MIQRLIDIKTDATAAFEKESKQLLVRLDDYFMLLALSDKRSGAWQAAEVISFDKDDWSNDSLIRDLQQKSSLIGYTGLDTQLYLTTTNALAIPKQFSHDAALFLATQFGKSNVEKILSTEVNDEVEVGYQVSNQQLGIINRLFAGAKLSSTLALLLKRAFVERSRKSSCLYLHISGPLAEMAFMQSGKLALTRCFHFSRPEELLYHLLNMARQFGVAPADVHIQLQGQITEETPLYSLVAPYFPHIHFAEDTSAIRHKAFWEVPPHFFTGLMMAV